MLMKLTNALRAGLRQSGKDVCFRYPALTALVRQWHTICGGHAKLVVEERAKYLARAKLCCRRSAGAKDQSK